MPQQRNTFFNMSHHFNRIQGMEDDGVASKKLPSTYNDRRSTLHVLFLHAGIRIKYLFLSCFYLKPLLTSALSGYPSFLRPKDFPEMDWPTLFALRLIMFLGGIIRAHPLVFFVLLKLRIMHLAGWIHDKLMWRIANKFKETGYDFSKARGVKVPEYDWKNGSPDEFYNTFVKRPHPVVLRGFFKDRKLMNNYSFDKFIERFGEEEVILTKPEKDGVLGKLKETVNPRVYLHNSEVICNKYPEIIQDIETERLEPYIKQKSGFCQFFCGRQGTGSPLHNASTWNFFHMVDGSKEWYFVDPYDFYYSSPLFVAGHAAAPFAVRYPDEFDKELFPAMQYCPYYTTQLQAGDVVFIPAWWGHGVRNKSDKSIGCATRWSPDGMVGKYFNSTEEDYDISRIASFIFFSGIKSFKFLQDILYEPAPRFDEHVTLREKHGRFIDRQMKISKGQMTFDGFRIAF